MLARAGIASRRGAEDLIADGRVSVNGEIVTELGTKADPEKDTIAVDGEPVSLPQKKFYLMLHKPLNCISTRDDPHGRDTVMDYVPRKLHDYIYPVGRLDFDATGLLLLTNDGRLTHALTHPSFEVSKVYRVKVQGRVEPEDIDRLKEGVELEDGPAVADDARMLSATDDSSTIELELHEGRKHEVKRLCKALGHPVEHLMRRSVGGVHIGNLPPGQWRELTDEEVQRLYAVTGIGGESGGQ
ncbi:MAG: pseudouridine synthase [Armatimonadota bacterium]